MWNSRRFIDDVELCEYWDFRIEWTNDAGRVKDPKALGTYLREQHVLLRRVKADVGMELPKVSRIVEPVDHDLAALRQIADLAHTLAIRATTRRFTERGQAPRQPSPKATQATGEAKHRLATGKAR